MPTTLAKEKCLWSNFGKSLKNAKQTADAMTAIELTLSKSYVLRRTLNPNAKIIF
jgi:hypothetical protein